MFCPNCGRQNPDTQIFCTSCGARVKASNALWKIAVVALALIAGLSWAAYLFSSSIRQTEQNTTQPQPLLSTNTNTTPLATVTQATPVPSRSAEIKPPAPSPTTTPTPHTAEVKPPDDEPDYSNGNPNTKVWVNTDSGVYHCPGTRWYGNTKYGEYMTQKEAQKKGYRPAYGNPCA